MAKHFVRTPYGNFWLDYDAPPATDNVQELRALAWALRSTLAHMSRAVQLRITNPRKLSDLLMAAGPKDALEQREPLFAKRQAQTRTAREARTVKAAKRQASLGKRVAAMERLDMSPAEIADRLRSEGEKVSRNTLAKHLKRRRK
jgi:aspartokinase